MTLLPLERPVETPLAQQVYDLTLLLTFHAGTHHQAGHDGLHHWAICLQQHLLKRRSSHTALQQTLPTATAYLDTSLHQFRPTNHAQEKTHSTPLHTEVMNVECKLGRKTHLNDTPWAVGTASKPDNRSRGYHVQPGVRKHTKAM